MQTLQDIPRRKSVAVLDERMLNSDIGHCPFVVAFQKETAFVLKCLQLNKQNTMQRSLVHLHKSAVITRIRFLP